jgi:uncharacterized protein
MDMISCTAHRLWGDSAPLPGGPWIMTQTWHNLLFAHWPVSPEALRPLVPAGLEIDTFDGDAWLGIIPFRLTGVRLRGLPEVRPVASFPEVNVRTYVNAAGKPGVQFLSLDANNRLAIAIAKPWFHLAYRLADISFRSDRCGIHFSSRRRERRAPELTPFGRCDAADFRASYRPCSPHFRSEPGTLEHWLTERYCYYSAAGRRLYRCDIHHDPWRLRRAQAEIESNTMALSHGIDLPATEPFLLYAHYMKALIWPVRRICDRFEGLKV